MLLSVDIIIALCWFAAFGLEVDALNNVPCGGAFDWGYIGDNDLCGRWKAAEAFSFLSAIIWLVSGILVCSTYSSWFGFVLILLSGYLLCLARWPSPPKLLLRTLRCLMILQSMRDLIVSNQINHRGVKVVATCDFGESTLLNMLWFSYRQCFYSHLLSWRLCFTISIPYSFLYYVEYPWALQFQFELWLC